MQKAKETNYWVNEGVKKHHAKILPVTCLCVRSTKYDIFLLYFLPAVVRVDGGPQPDSPPPEVWGETERKGEGIRPWGRERRGTKRKAGTWVVDQTQGGKNWPQKECKNGLQLTFRSGHRTKTGLAWTSQHLWATVWLFILVYKPCLSVCLDKSYTAISLSIPLLLQIHYHM